ncbi:hypothetical protein E2C01_002919 [Portunus trituberculatus]|uniref:Uncharacterized protein n=1 Tax=Portunus trituberculatus TaxID=210409 RepID=A0A5B7CPG6_PORTR|nr:hypothetical protein [Portunus trituberculatus]
MVNGLDNTRGDAILSTPNSNLCPPSLSIAMHTLILGMAAVATTIAHNLDTCYGKGSPSSVHYVLYMSPTPAVSPMAGRVPPITWLLCVSGWVIGTIGRLCLNFIFIKHNQASKTSEAAKDVLTRQEFPVCTLCTVRDLGCKQHTENQSKSHIPALRNMTPGLSSRDS